MSSSEGSREQGRNETLPEPGLAVPRPPPTYLRLVSVCEPITLKARDEAAGAPVCEQPQLPRQSNKSRGLLDRSIQAQIGRMLRDVFSDLAEEPVPDRFVSLLEALEAQEKLR